MAKIAIVEPDSQLRELFTQALSADGHEVVEAGACDLLLLEPNLEAGRDLVAQLLAAERDLRIVCVSSRPPDAWVERIATVFLLKPFGLVELRAAIAAAVR